jgi:predicted transcriptional regulator
VASSPTTKEKVLDVLRRLPPDATIEDAMERLYFLGKVERGLKQADAGEVVSHEEARRYVNEWRG